MDHRRTPSRKAYVPASWFIVLTILLCVGAAGWLGWLYVDGGSETETTDATPPATSSTPTPEPTKTTSKATPTPSKPKPSKTKATQPVVRRDVPVSVLNNTTIQGLATTYSAKVRAAGWTVGAIGNWRGSIAGNTIYYPSALLEQARLLGRDLGIGRILPIIATMQTDRLTIILSGPQQ